MLFASVKLYFIKGELERQAEIKYKKAMKLIQEETKKLEHLHDECEQLEPNYQRKKLNYLEQKQKYQDWHKTNQPQNLKSRLLNFILSLKQEPHEIKKNYHQSKKEFNTVYKRKAKIKQQHHESLHKVSNEVEKTVKWIKRRKPKKIICFDLKQREDILPEINNYNKLRKRINKDPNSTDTKIPFSQTISWTSLFLKNPTITRMELYNAHANVVNKK